MFKKTLRTVAAAMTAALAVSLAACSSTGGAPRDNGDGSGGGTVVEVRLPLDQGQA